MKEKTYSKEPVINYIQSIGSVWKETGYISIGEMTFEDINPDDVLTFEIRVYVTTVVYDRSIQSR